jgi:hypothetical protein
MSNPQFQIHKFIVPSRPLHAAYLMLIDCPYVATGGLLAPRACGRAEQSLSRENSAAKPPLIATVVGAAGVLYEGRCYGG